MQNHEKDCGRFNLFDGSLSMIEDMERTRLNKYDGEDYKSDLLADAMHSFDASNQLDVDEEVHETDLNADAVYSNDVTISNQLDVDDGEGCESDVYNSGVNIELMNSGNHELDAANTEPITVRQSNTVKADLNYSYE